MAAWGQYGGRNRKKASVHINDSPNCCLLLLQKGANPNVPDIYGAAPLATACGTGGDGCIDLLIEFGADINH